MSARLRTPLAFPVAIALTFAVSLLPGSWRHPWQGEVAEVVHFLIRPFKGRPSRTEWERFVLDIAGWVAAGA